MLTSYELLLGLVLLYERNQQKESTVSGWSGLLVQAADKQVLIERECLKEIVSLSKATRVLDERTWLTGLMSYEGAIIPLIELCTIINNENQPLGLKDRSVLVISLQSGTIGLLVDRVHGRRDYWSDDSELSALKVIKEGCSKVSFSYKGEYLEVCDLEKLTAMIGISREVAVDI